MCQRLDKSPTQQIPPENISSDFVLVVLPNSLQKVIELDGHYLV